VSPGGVLAADPTAPPPPPGQANAQPVQPVQPPLPPGQANALPDQSNAAVPAQQNAPACPPNAPPEPPNAQQTLPNALPDQGNASPCQSNGLPGQQNGPNAQPAQPNGPPGQLDALPAQPNTLLGQAGAQLAPPVAVLPEPETTVTYYVSDTSLWDNNLYRLSEGSPAPVIDGMQTSRTDYINTVSAGLDGTWYYSRQRLSLDLRIDDNRFARNSVLNNVSGAGLVQDDWSLGDRLSGRVGATYTRFLPGFANNRFFARDLLDNDVLFGEGRFAVTPHWFLRADGDHTDTTHSLAPEKINDFVGSSAGFGLEYEATGEIYPVPGPDYHTTAEDLLAAKQTIVGLDYTHSTGSFPHQVLFDSESFDRDYGDHTWAARVAAPVAAKTVLHASVGYLDRQYPNASIHDFHGVVWDSSLDWQPTEKTTLTVEAWRKLTGYIEAQSDYFVSNLRSATAEWRPTDKLTLDAQFGYDHQLYIGSNPTTITLIPRRDTLRSRQLRMSYTVAQHVQLTLSYNDDTRSSNQPLLPYDDTLASVGIRVQF
jgi:hypothetical protein